MSELDELTARVNAATAEMTRFDDDMRQEIQDKDFLISSLRATNECHEAEALEAKSDIARLRSETRQLKDMLMTLLAAVESRRKENVNEALTQLDAEVTEIVAAESGDEMDRRESEEQPEDEALLAVLEFSNAELPPHIDDMFEDEDSSENVSADEQVGGTGEEPLVLSQEETEKAPEKSGFAAKWPWNARKDDETRPPAKPH